MLLTNARVATMKERTGYGLIEGGAIQVDRNGEIAWVGRADHLPNLQPETAVRDLEGRLVTPGLIDCHTHVVFGGNRAAEFEMRLGGVSYEKISRSGGGIASTVKATREASQDSLLKQALLRVDAFIAEGVTTIEIKSGYGLTIESELRMLRVARQIAQLRPISVSTTYLAAHAVPPEYKGCADDFIANVVLPGLEQAHAENLVDAVDGFCEGIAFDTQQIERVFAKARDLGIPVKLHAEQLSHQGGTALATRFNALSADHLEYATKEDAEKMAASGTVAVILPGAFYTLSETQRPPIDAFRAHGVDMALASDCNPGSSPLTSLLLAMNMGCTLFGMTPAEALAGVTRNAARALGQNNRGTIAEGQRADLVVWDVEHPAELAYRIGFNPLYARLYGGLG